MFHETWDGRRDFDLGIGIDTYLASTNKYLEERLGTTAGSAHARLSLDHQIG